MKVENRFGEILRDEVLKFQLDNEAGNLLTVSSAGNSITVSLLSKTGKDLGHGTFEVGGVSSLVNVRLDHLNKSLIFTFASGNSIVCDLTSLYDSKQDTLVSGTNIKTINNTSVLGSGNINIPTEPENYVKDVSYSALAEKLVFVKKGNSNDVSLEFSVANKVDKVEGKGLSTNDYTNEEKAKVNSAYQKPASGVPKTDLSSDVQVSLGKADTSVQKVSTINKVYGTNASGEQTTYDKDDFGKVNNVLVDGTSVLVNKVANINLSGKVSKTQTIAGVDLQDNITSQELRTGLNVSDGANKVESSSTNGNIKIDGVETTVYNDTEVRGLVTSESQTRATEDLVLSERINSLEGRGRYLSSWNVGTGTPGTYPVVPEGAVYPYTYTYKAGDYYIVASVPASGTKYKPSGSSISKQSASSGWLIGADETSEYISINDYFLYDGTVWTLIRNSSAQATWGNIGGNISSQTDLQSALSGKQNTITSENKLSSSLVDDSSSTNKFVTDAEKSTWSGKQDTLTQGTNITISGTTISATDTTYSAGTNVSITDGVISATDTTYTAGNNVSITDGVISATDTTYDEGAGITISDGVISNNGVLSVNGNTGAITGMATTTALEQGLATKQPLGNYATVTQLSSKQDTLTQGNNITILGSTISATDTTYTAGSNVHISEQNVISATDTTYTEGSGINIENNVISVDSSIATKTYVDSRHDSTKQDVLGFTPEDVSNKQNSIDDSTTHYPTSGAVRTFVNSSIASATANFKGTLDVVTDLGLSYGATTSAIATALDSHTFVPSATVNDYCFVINKDTNNTIYQRFKFDGTHWLYEYTLNNSSFTSSQWNAINSGATTSNIGQISTNASAISGIKDGTSINSFSGVETALSGKQSTLTSSQQSAVNSGITGTKVETYDGYAIGKQDALVSGTNIKTINNTSILGSGDITIGMPLNGVLYEEIVITYTLTPTFTNITGQPSSATQVVQGGSQTFTLTADGISYKLPTKITVASTEVSAGSSQTITDKCTVLYTRTSNTAGTIAFSNVTDDVAFSVAGEAVASYPVKGQLITMNLGNETPAAGTNNQYRVLSINGSVAEVVAMYDMPNITFNKALYENIYAGGELDTYLNTTFYNSLSSTAKSAIVDKNITQYQYTNNSSVYNADTHASYADYSTKASKAVVGSRHVYALDVEDIETYFNNTFSTANIWTLFWNTTAKPSTVTYPWLRSALADSSDYAWYVFGYRGYVRNGVDDLRAARPALTIDLSKISWNYTITPTFTNVTGQPSSATQVQSGGSQTFTVTADGTSYKLPTKITVAGTEVIAGSSAEISGKCTVLFTRTSDTAGTIAFSNVTDDVAFSVVGSYVYRILVYTSNISADISNPTTISEDETVVLAFTTDGINYKCPTIAPNVKNATALYNRISDTQCTITVSNPTGWVEFTIVGVPIGQGEIWYFNDYIEENSVSFTGLNFISDNQTFSSISVYYHYDDEEWRMYYDNTQVYYTPWEREVYRTVVFASPVDTTTTFGQWLSRNAVKQ